MIFDTFVEPSDPDMMYTIVDVDGRRVLVGMEAKELFRKVLGDEEWNRRCRTAYFKACGVEPQSHKPPKPIAPPDNPVKRFIQKGIGKWQNS